MRASVASPAGARRRRAAGAAIRRLVKGAAAAGVVWMAARPADAQSLDGTADRIRARLEAIPAPEPVRAAGEPVLADAALRQFYAGRVYRPGWSVAGEPGAPARDLVGALRDLEDDGLRPDDYHLIPITGLLRRTAAAGRLTAAEAADLDLLLTDAFLLAGSHLLSGRVNPESFDPEWVANRRGADMTAALVEALRSGEVPEALDRLRPSQPGYHRLRARRRQLAALVAAGDREGHREGAARAGDGWDDASQVAGELARRGDLDEEGVRGGSVSETDVERAVRRFQERHGLAVTGVVDSATRAELAVSPADRLRQIDLNLERWRWLPESMGDRHILVNVAAFELRVVEGQRVVMSMPVIVGRDYRRTPVFSSDMTYLVVAPYWHVPTSIAVRDKLPLIRRDPTYLQRLGYHVFDGWGADSREIDPATVDWAAVPTAPFPYRLRQDPGPANALGNVKFMFPNRFNVYLHDTPQRELFDESERTFSSGCIRLSRPMELAEYLLRDQPEWDRARLDRTVAARVETTVPLHRAVPVHLQYWTAWVDDDGALQFRRDVYGRDRRLEAALNAPRPS